MSGIWQEVHKSLMKGQDIVVATIVAASGSTPRSAGSKLAVYKDGRITGTIGGGAVEADVIQSAMNLFSSQGVDLLSFNCLDTSSTDQMDMICGGSIRVLIEYVACNAENLKMYGLLRNSVQMSQSLLWVGRLDRSEERYHFRRSLQTIDNSRVNSLLLPTELRGVIFQNSVCHNMTLLHTVEDQHYVVEFIQPPEIVYLVGGGHVSKAVSTLLLQIDFRFVVADDRAKFVNKERFPDAEQLLVTTDYHGVFESSSIGPSSYILIMTRGHHYDKLVLAQALKTEAGYIGMIGSRRKRDHIFGLLMDEGFTDEDLQRVFCPVGLDIDAETPSEIGISIIAQLIQHRAVIRKDV